MKFMFDPLHDLTCEGCRRRGSVCVSQEFPNQDRGKVGAPGATFNNDGRRNEYGIPTPSSTVSESLPYISLHKLFGPLGKHEKLSRLLHAALTTQEDTEKICRANGHNSVLSHELLTRSYTTLDRTGLQMPESLQTHPEPTAHPVLIAKYMLLLAIFILHLGSDIHAEMVGLTEPPRNIMERLVDLATKLVTKDEDLLGSIEGLECVMIESVYQANMGNLRRSWVANRRALSFAHLMGLDRPNKQTQLRILDATSRYDSQIMWLRILNMDRHLCLMLGLPQGCQDRSMASDEMLTQDTLLGCSERLHCVIASKNLERDEAKLNFHDLTLRRTLDLELQKAARSLPSEWWLTPVLDITSSDSLALFWDTRHLFAQVFHYNLLNQLHLPYMFQSKSTEHEDEYSRTTCVNASREILTRFLIRRNYNKIAYSCRAIDFIALMAAMTLLLAHLNSHTPNANNFFAHQYPSDRGMIERVQERMEELNRLNSDALSAQSADLLHRLLTIKTEVPGDTERVSVLRAEAMTIPPGQDEDAIVNVHISYFGIVRITPEGFTREVTKCPAIPATDRLDGSVCLPDADFGTSLNTCYGQSDHFMQRDEFPELMAEGED